MRTLKRIIIRLPLIFLLLTLISLFMMVLIRIGGSGTRLLTTSSKMGKYIAANYNSCIITFIVIAVLFVLITLAVGAKKSARKNRALQVEEEVDEDEAEFYEAPDDAEAEEVEEAFADIAGERPFEINEENEEEIDAEIEAEEDAAESAGANALETQDIIDEIISEDMAEKHQENTEKIENSN